MQEDRQTKFLKARIQFLKDELKKEQSSDVAIRVRLAIHELEAQLDPKPALQLLTLAEM